MSHNHVVVVTIFGLLAAGIGIVLPTAAGDTEAAPPSYEETRESANASGLSLRFHATTIRDRQCSTLSVGGISFPGFTRAVPIPNTSLTFRQGGNAAAPVLVSFVATWPRPTDGELANEDPAVPPAARAGAKIALLIDGARADIVSDQGDVPALQVHDGSATGDSNGTHSFTFVTRPVEPGDHTLTLLWSPIPITAADTLCIAERTLSVQHH